MFEMKSYEVDMGVGDFSELNQFQKINLAHILHVDTIINCNSCLLIFLSVLICHKFM